MRKTVKVFAFLIGLSALLLSFNSCKKDDDKECCSWTYGSETHKYCEGGYNGTTKLSGSDWTFFKTYIKTYFNATCK